MAGLDTTAAGKFVLEYPQRKPMSRNNENAVTILKRFYIAARFVSMIDFWLKSQKYGIYIAMFRSS
jgi:hypothetical protein